MNKQMAQYIQGNLTEIISNWQEKMKNEKDERAFQVMPVELMNQTSHEFAELMISNLLESHQAYESRVNDFAEKVVRLGWSITFVTKAINHFAEIVYEGMVREEIINEGNIKPFVDEFSNWISPIRDSTIQAYSKTWERTVSLQKIALQELSASLIPVFEKVSVMPLVGTIDTERAKLIMENLLEGVVKHRAEVVLLDITGVPVVDTMVAHHIIQAADAVRLVGAKCMLVGIRPEIAQTIVTLGINLNDFTTTSTLQRGVEQALAWTNRKIVEVED
ncbi:RsbT co-antagonist protein RsbRA [Microbacterium sp. APC 3898]|uniref:RsbT co-antagonist protein RsbRA n=2 Tax=Planococcus TaxID=1372 RepID=A0ABT7ZMA8_9BACL|nr:MULTISPECIES: RsbT co-antagonist protein RsbRA [Terrabacteria group]MBF6633707.1 STAS domain-containing protein [Planococcus sp. (in: firmicutes)]MBD8015403.1 STAS domain-containing protein [Planococcus wigleyi]MDN3428290.1 RsbT co-antagonist protein RsbRA [Planococcus sp. APC 4016]MDN3439391.1 RsbT co-antagonist protein RsbRA [Planococcus sp. APC 3900]MDN3498172.1 RsbT co-antagonist protein RsbRA [Microbacterium sp. APC 3898]